MPHETERNEEETTLKSYLVSGLYAIIGLLGLVAISHYWPEHDHRPWWYPAVENGFAIIAGAGFIGILFELNLRRSLITETVARLKTLFDSNPEFAKSLSNKAREERVESTLKAHLGSELGHAIFQGLVHRYFDKDKKYRKEGRFIVTLSSCTNLKVNNFLPNAALTLNNYCNLLADYSFRVKFKHTGSISVICTLSDDMADLYETFRRIDCIAREIIQLETADRIAIVEAWKTLPDAQRPEFLQSIARAELSFNGTPLKQTGVHFMESNLSIVFEFDSTGRKQNPDLDKYKIVIRSIFSRATGIFPIILADPTYDPVVELNYPDPRIVHVATTPFITSDEPFAPRVANDLEARKVTIDTTNDEGEPGWVFPSSGVIFTWKSS